MTEETKELTDEQKKFAIIKTLDGWRWDITSNDVLEGYKNYSFGEHLKECFEFDKEDKIKVNNNGELIVNDKLTSEFAEKVLLTHHLIYICNRQTGARRVFSEGAEVISNIVEDYYKDKNKENFDFNEFIKKHVESDNISKEEKKRNYKHRLNANGKTFASKNTAQDYYCIFRTLETLLEKHFNKYLEKTNINELVQELFELTYQGVTRLSSADSEFIYIYEKFKEKFTEKKMDRHQQKRLWCEVRDFLYDPVLKECFKIIVGKEFEKYDVSYLELPGDVWNNNSKFAECFWGEKYTTLKNKNFNSSKFVRTQFENDKKNYQKNDKNSDGTQCWGGCYPHNFDITFNFVPRMCESNNCSMCPICKDKNENEKIKKENKKIKNEDWKKLCHKKKGNYCSFALYATGVKHVCNGEDCEIFKMMKNNQQSN